MGAGSRAVWRDRPVPVRRLVRGRHDVRAGRHPLITYGVPVPPFAGLYMKAVLSQPHVAESIDKAQDEPWVIDQYEADGAAQ